MKKKFSILILAALALFSCADPEPIASSINGAESSSSILSASSKEATLSSSSSETLPSSLPVPSSSSQSSSSKEVSSSLPPVSSSSVPSASSYNVGGDTLPNGSRKLDAPENISSPIDVSNWVNYEMIDDLPSYWTFIYGNNTPNPSFYASSHGGGIKMDQVRKGLQSPAFNSWKKLEVRITISSVNNNSQNVNSHKNKPIMLIYGYDSASNLIVQDEIAEGSINANTNEVHFYLRNESLAYFELRLNAFPYKGSQCYNFGIGGVAVKGWNYV